MKKGDNDNIRILEIRGTSHSEDLLQSLLEMSLTSELTKTDKGLYNCQACPAYGEDRLMTDEDWLKVADIWEEEADFVGQKRAIVLHDKKGKLHAHIVWERYDHEKGIMIPNKFSRLAQDRARIRIEKEFGHKATPDRNKQRPEMKTYLSDVWHQTQDAGSFINVIAGNGYVIANGTQRPYMVIDATGRSFDLVRQLDGVKTKVVRERFKTTKLVKEKEAIEHVRSQQRVAVQTKRSSLTSAANDNIQQITAAPKQQDKVARSYSMKFNFTIDNSAKAKVDDKQVKKQQVLEKLKLERLQKAKEFRENERDL